MQFNYFSSFLTLLTNHTEVIQQTYPYLWWLLPLQIFWAMATLLEGYFIGLKAGYALRNASLIAFCGIFSPLALTAWYFQNVNLLWIAPNS